MKLRVLHLTQLAPHGVPLLLYLIIFSSLAYQSCIIINLILSSRCAILREISACSGDISQTDCTSDRDSFCLRFAYGKIFPLKTS